MYLMEFAMFPTDKGESVSEYVSQIIDLIHESGLSYKLTPMGTIVEGERSQILGLIDKCLAKLEPQANRIYSSIKVDFRKGEESRMTSKTDKIKSILKKDISV